MSITIPNPIDSTAIDANIELFKGKLKDGARPNRFIVEFLDVPGGKDIFGTANLKYFVKSASIPQMTVGTIEVNWMGQKIKLGGDPVFADWTVTFVNDSGFGARKIMEAWMARVVDIITNTRGTQGVYKMPIRIKHLGGNNAIIAAYELIGGFPSDLGEVTLGQDQNDTLEEFTCTFAYDYWLPIKVNGIIV